MATVKNLNNTFSTIDLTTVAETHNVTTTDIIGWSLVKKDSSDDLDNDEPLEVFILKRQINCEYNQVNQKLNDSSNTNDIFQFIIALCVWHESLKESGFWDETIALEHALFNFFEGKLHNELYLDMYLHKIVQTFDDLINWLVRKGDFNAKYSELKHSIYVNNYDSNKSAMENFQRFEKNIFYMQYVECLLKRKQYDRQLYNNTLINQEYISIFVEAMDPMYREKYSDYLSTKLILNREYNLFSVEPQTLKEFGSILSLVSAYVDLEKNIIESDTIDDNDATIATTHV